MRNALAYVPKGQHQMVAAAIRTVFAQDTQAAASKTWRHVADQLRPRLPVRVRRGPPCGMTGGRWTLWA